MADRVEVDLMELAGRLTVAEGTLEAHGNRLDGIDDTLAVQGRYLDGQQRQHDQLERVVSGLQNVVEQSNAFFAQCRAGLKIAGAVWKWGLRPALGVAATIVGGALFWTLAHLGPILHALDKLSAFLSQ